MLLTFWAPGLRHAETSSRNCSAYKTYLSTGFTILAVNYRETGNARLSQHLSGLHVNLQAVIDPEGKIATAYGVDIGLPINVLLDRSGTVVKKMSGYNPPPLWRVRSPRLHELDRGSSQSPTLRRQLPGARMLMDVSKS